MTSDQRYNLWGLMRDTFKSSPDLEYMQLMTDWEGRILSPGGFRLFCKEFAPDMTEEQILGAIDHYFRKP